MGESLESMEAVKEEEKGGAPSSSSGGYNSNIDIFLRLRPIPSGAGQYAVEDESHIEFVVPKDATSGYVNNSREKYDFKFNGIFDMDAKQDVVFERIAHKVVVGALDGFNGTIFAYGQTGSGKTFTITGGAERYVDRGIIPRAISLIFGELAKRSDYAYSVHFSYLEIYNETGYDLLDPNHETKALEDLPKVALLEDEENRIHLRNLSAHLATNEEEALNLLFLGDTNRMISATPMNMASSRSHCIFTASIEARKAGEETVRRSKLHLVDLAGSERVSKTNVEGLILKEAKYINLSLHFLEQVIVALQERSQGKPRQHIPYRNSMMTSVLRDSLGGNCRTVMIATVNVAHDQLDETISTCRFAQRVAMVSNQVVVNEEVDPMLVIKRLKQEIRDLKEEVRLLRGEDQDRGPITESELDTLRRSITAFVGDQTPDAALNIGASMMHIRAAFGIFKDMLLKGGVAIGGVAPPTGKAAVIASTSPQDTADVQEQLRKLRLQVQQRDNEINILVSMLRKREAAAGGVPSGPHSTLQPLPTERNTSTKHLGDPAAPQPESAMHTSTSTTLPATTHGSTSLEAAPAAAAAAAAEERLQRAQAGAQAGTSGRSGGRPGERSGVEPAVAGVLGGGSMTLLADRNKAFEMFRRSYRKNEVIEENKALLKAKYTEAKALGEQVNAGRERINGMKANIEKRRMERAMHEIAGGGPAAADALPPDPEEDRMKSIIEAEKVSYKDSFARLRELKREIEHLQMILEQSRVRLQRDFEEWLGVMARQQLHPPASPPPSHTRASAPPHSLHPPSLSKPLLPLNAPPRSDPPSSRQKPPPLPETARGAMRDSTNIFQSLTGSSQTVPSQSSATTNRGPPSGGPRIAWGTLDAPPPPLAPPIATSFGKGVVASGPVERPPSGSSNRGIMDDDGWVTRSDKAGSLVSPSSPFSLISMATSHTSPSTRLYDGSSPHIAKGGVPIRTGDAKADADIAAFYAARQKLLRERELGRKAPDS